MRFVFSRRFAQTLLLAAGLSLYHTALALVSINEGKNQVFIVGTVSYSWDSNIFVSSTGVSDSIYLASVGMEYQRRAGMIGVNANAYLDITHFAQHPGQDSKDPRAHLELTKDSGRTTGSLTLDVARQNRADAVANLRVITWNYSAGLNLKYPVIDRYSLAGAFNYAHTMYVGNPQLVDLSTYTLDSNLFYTLDSAHDLIASYRLRYSQTSAKTAYYDHAFMAGLSGRILPKLSGTVRAGYQFRVPTRRGDQGYSDYTITAQTTWNISKRMSADMSVSKDFNISSTDISLDTTSVNLDGQYALTSHLTILAGLGGGTNRFLGRTGNGRVDRFFTWHAGVNYVFNTHLQASMSYTYLRNWSNVAFSSFERNGIDLSLAAKF